MTRATTSGGLLCVSEQPCKTRIARATNPTGLTQPLLVVAGSEAGSLWHSQELYAKAPGPKELFMVKGATHMDLYIGERVTEAMGEISPFFKRNLLSKA